MIWVSPCACRSGRLLAEITPGAAAGPAEHLQPGTLALDGGDKRLGSSCFPGQLRLPRGEVGRGDFDRQSHLTGAVTILPNPSWATPLPPWLGKLRPSRGVSCQDLRQQGGIPVWTFPKGPSGRCPGRCGALGAH